MVYCKLVMHLLSYTSSLAYYNSFTCAGNELKKHITSKKALIVTNTKVGPIYSNIVKKSLENSGIYSFIRSLTPLLIHSRRYTSLRGCAT